MKSKIMSCTELVGWFLLGACLAVGSRSELVPRTEVPLPPELCQLAPESIRQEVVAADQAGLHHLVDYDLRLLAAQVNCPPAP